MKKHKLPYPYNWYYKSYVRDNKCPFCGSENIYCSRDNNVVFCRHYQCYVSLHDCESQTGEDAIGGCKSCSWEPSIFCPIQKTSIPIIDCKEESEHNPFCRTCKSIEIWIPTQAELRTDLVYVCDDCDKGVDFTNQKTFEKYSS